jgi:hypothetical protein
MVCKSYSGFSNFESTAIRLGLWRGWTWCRAVKLHKAGQGAGPALLCGVALDRALYPVEQRPQFARVDAVRSHKIANDRIGQQIVD